MKYLAIASLMFVTACTGIQQDKVLHFGAGALVAEVVTSTTGNPVDGVIGAGIAGIGKETVAVINGGKFSLPDVVATIAGGLIGIIKWKWEF